MSMSSHSLTIWTLFPPSSSSASPPPPNGIKLISSVLNHNIRVYWHINGERGRVFVEDNFTCPFGEEIHREESNRDVELEVFMLSLKSK